MSKLKRERVESVDSGALGIVGYVTQGKIAGHDCGITAGSMAALEAIIKHLYPNMPFDPQMCRKAVHIRTGQVTLDDEL